MKPIRMKQNLAVAEKVRRAINRINQSVILMRNSWFECFDNGREQGFVLKVWCVGMNQFTIAFSECRNSDEIVVYCYTTHLLNNLPATDADWADRKYFSYKEVDLAAQYILDRAGKMVKDPTT
jgi:hypothetical protein